MTQTIQLLSWLGHVDVPTIATGVLSLVALGLNGWVAVVLWRQGRKNRRGAKCNPQFTLKLSKPTATDIADLAAFGCRLDPDHVQEEWSVVCDCRNAARCPWAELALERPFVLDAAVDCDLLTQVSPGDETACAPDVDGHATRVYGFEPNTRWLGIGFFIKAALQSEPPCCTPVIRNGVEGTQAGTKHSDAERYPLNPAHAAHSPVVGSSVAAGLPR